MSTAPTGAELIAVPTAQMEPFSFVNEHVIRVRAWENSVYVAYVNQTGRDGERPADLRCARHRDEQGGRA